MYLHSSRRLLSTLALLLLSATALVACGNTKSATVVPQAGPPPPAQPIKLIFIHHSCGSNWLSDDSGALGIALRDNNYFVSDSNYGWGPDAIGDHTDIGHWWTWFRGDKSDTYTAALYAESNTHASYSRMPQDPGGENRIIMFKSCYPNSNISGSLTDPPTTGDNPLRGQDSGSAHMTVANAKGIYNDLLPYFAAHQYKLFIAVTAPPLVPTATDDTRAENARAFNNWLVNDWLDNYPHNNVAVFDFYNVLTSGGRNSNVNDLDKVSGNHHRWNAGAVEHIQTVDNNTSAYGTGGDSHPTAAGNEKATTEFVPLLNHWVQRWQNDPPPQASLFVPAMILKVR